MGNYKTDLNNKLSEIPKNDSEYFYIFTSESSEVIKLPIFEKKTAYTAGDYQFFENASQLDICYDLEGNELEYLQYEKLPSYMLKYNAFGYDLGITINNINNIIINLKRILPYKILTNIVDLNYKIYEEQTNFDIHSYFPLILNFEMSKEKLKGESLYIYIIKE